MKVTRFLYDLKIKEKEDLDKHIKYCTSEMNRISTEYGDLSENSEYDVLKNERTMAMSQSEEIIRFLDEAEIVENTGLEDSTRIILGSILRLTVIDRNGNEFQKIVLFDGIENYMSGIISPNSNLGKKIDGIEAGTPITLKVETPTGALVQYTVEKLINCNEYDLYLKSNKDLKTRLDILFKGIGEDSSDNDSHGEVNPNEISKALQGYK